MVQSAILPAKFSEDNTSRASKSSFGAESTMSLLVDSLKDRLLLAVPKKGRLHEKCVELLTGESNLILDSGFREPKLMNVGADIKYNRAHRLDVALVQNHPLALYVDF